MGPIAVDYTTSDGSARAGVEYQAVSGTLQFHQNETVQHLTIPLLVCRAAAGAKYFRITLSNPTGGATLGTSLTTVYIRGAYSTAAPPFDTALSIRPQWGVNVLSWNGGGTLQRADRLTGRWQGLANAKSPYPVESPVPITFYRVTRPRPVNLYVPSSCDGQTNLSLLIPRMGSCLDKRRNCHEYTE